MRVAVDGLLLWGRYSGVERAVARLTAALPRVDPEGEYTVYVPADAAVDEVTAAGLRVRRAPFPGRRKLARIFWQQCVLPALLRHDGAEALLAPGYVMPLRWRGPSVLIIYDVIALTHPRLARAGNVRHYRLVLPRAARRATRVVAPTGAVAASVSEQCRVPPEKVAVVPLGIEPGFRRVADAAVLSAVRARYRLPERFLLYVGNLEPKKNLPGLLEAFALLRRGGETRHLVLAGEPGWGLPELHAALARTGVAEAVRLTGFVPDADLPALYSLADLFLFPSLVEGFGLPPLEAMACGTPAVVADVPPFPETVGDAALRVDPRAPRAIAAGVRRVLEDEPLRKRLVEAGPRRAALFTWEAAARRVAELLREAAGVTREADARV